MNIEMFRTEIEYEESLIVKLFIMFSFNYYSHAFYIAFLKGRFKLNLNGTTYSETVCDIYIKIKFINDYEFTFETKSALTLDVILKWHFTC